MVRRISGGSLLGKQESRFCVSMLGSTELKQNNPGEIKRNYQKRRCDPQARRRCCCNQKISRLDDNTSNRSAVHLMQSCNKT